MARTILQVIAEAREFGSIVRDAEMAHNPIIRRAALEDWALYLQELSPAWRTMASNSYRRAYVMAGRRQGVIPKV